MRNRKHQNHSITQTPSGVRWLDTALDTSRKRYTLLFPRISNTDALPTGLNTCDFTSSSLTKGLEVKSSAPALLFLLPNLCVLKSRTAKRVVKK
jgi:hypothetical protein